MFKPIISHITIFFLCFSQAFSTRAFAENLPIHTDGATNTQVTQTASGIDQINIAAPNSSGLSHNTFSDYNVNQAGQVINNFSGQNVAEVVGGSGANAVTSTQIGGLVTANENLVNSGAARIILNEVTSTNETYLNGYVEIAGTRAELIIANPNGISCSGCGFINTSKFSLIAGSSEFDQSGNLGFNIKEQKDLAIPLITISGLGLDAESTSSANIIASSIKLLATIYGGENTDVNLQAGDGKYNYATGALAQNQNSSNPNQELFAVDASNLGVIQAGRIFITATRAGFGVNLGGDVIATGEMDIDAQGNIFYHNISAGEKANLTSNRNISAVDSTAQISAPNLNLHAAGEVQNSGNIMAYQLAISSAQLTNSGVIQALDLDISNLHNLTNSSIIYGENSLKISSENLTNLASGNIFSPQSYAINLTALLTNSGVISSNEQLTISANQLTNSGEISAQNNLIISATTIGNLGNLISTKTLTIQGQSLENSGQIQSSDDANFSLATLQNLENATIYSAKNLNLNLSDSLTNLGEISAQNNFTIQGEAALSNSNKILALGDLNIAGRSLSNNQNAIISSLASSLVLTLSSDLQNSGELNSQKDLTINSGDLTNSGNILGNESLTITAENLSNDGNLISSQKATINVAALTNQVNGIISSSDDLAINVTNSLSNLGEISTQKNLFLTSFDLENSGTIYAAQNFEITSQNNLSNSGLLYSENEFTLSAKNFTNQLNGQIFSAENIGVNISENFSNSGILQSDGTLNLSSNNALNSGEITTAQLIISNQENFENSGNLQSNSTLFLNSQSFNNSGNLISAQKATINLESLTNQISGVIASTDDLEINVTNSLSNLGEISTQKNLSLTSFDLENSGTIYAANNLEISAQNNFSNSALLYSENNFALATKNFDNQLSGQIFSAENLDINIAENFTNSGALTSQKDLQISSANFTNSGDILSNEALSIITQNLNNSGNLQSNFDLNLTAQNFENSANIISEQKATINVDALINQVSGVIYAVNNLEISAQNNLSNAGLFYSENNLTLSAKDFTNSGTAAATKDHQLSITNSISNSGEISAQNNLEINAATITNSGNIFSSELLSTTAASLDNQSGATLASINNSLNLNLSNHFTNSGQVFAGENLGISGGANFTNSGSLSAQNNFTLSANIFDNSATISADELTLNFASFNNSGSINSLSDLTINATSSGTNSGEILSGKNLSITAIDLTNSNKIHSENSLLLTLRNLTNSQEIISVGSFTINASAAISNSKKLQAGSTFNINADSFTNSSNALTLANGNLTITAKSISNQNTKPNNSVIATGLVSVAGNVILRTDNLNNDSGIIAAKSTSVTALNSPMVSLSNNLGKFISTADINLNLGDADYAITGEVTASNVDITARNITNSGQVTATDFIKLTANGSASSGNGNITNSTSSSSLAAGSYLMLIANLLITNNGTISAETDLTLTSNSGSINNNGTITGGTGTTTISANGGSFNNSLETSKLTAANNLILSASDDLNNYGEISAANDLTTNVADGLYNNSGALIWSGRDATLNVSNTLLNSWSDIYADRNLTIQKNDSVDNSLNKTTLLQNVSGNIETYFGNIVIKAATLENKRAIDPINKLLDVSGNKTIYSVNVAPTNFNAYKWDYDLTETYGDRHTSYNNIYFAKALLNSDSKEALIYAGNQLSLNLNNLSNNTSNIVSAGNSTINFSSALNNISVYDPGLLFQEIHDRNIVGYNIISLSSPLGLGYPDRAVHRADYAQTFSSLIKSGGALAITQNGSSAANIINGTTVAQYSQSSGIAAQSQTTTFNNIDSYTLSQTGVINVDLTRIISAINSSAVSVSSKAQSSDVTVDTNPIGDINITTISNAKDGLSDYNLLSNNLSLTKISDAKNTLKNPSEIQSNQSSINSPNLTTSIPDTIFSGNFKINFNADPNVPLVESRSQFTDISKFYGSSYYFTQLGFNGDDFIEEVDQLTRNTVRIFGDAYVEDKLISDRLISLRKDAIFLSTNSTDQTAEIREMINNSVSELSRLGLSATSIAANGLTTAQANSLNKDIITFEVQNVNGIMALVPKIYLSQASRTNLLGSGSSDDLSNPSIASSATIFGKTSITINAPNTSLINSGSIISAGNITLDLASLTNKTTSNNKAEIIAGIKSSEINIPTISPITYTPANLTIVTSGDIKNIGAKLFAANQINLTSSTGNILNTSIIGTNDKTLLDSNSDAYLSNDLTQRTTSGNISSTLLHSSSIQAGEININAANNFTNLAAGLSAKKNGLSDSSTASGDVNITAGNDINISTLQLRNRSEESWGNKKRGGLNIDDQTTHLSSEIIADGNINLTSGGNFNLVGSKVEAKENLTLTSSGDINILNSVDSLLKESYSHKNGLSRQSNSAAIDYTETAVKSSLIGNDINISSLGDATIQGSDIAAKNNLIIGSFTIAQNPDGSYQKDSNGNYVTISGSTVDNLTIKNADLNEYHYANTQRGYAGIVADFMKAVSFIEPIKISETSATKTDSTTALSSSVDVGGSLMINSVGDTTITGSNITVADNFLANSLGNFTIQAAANNSSSSSSKESTSSELHSDFNLENLNYRAGNKRTVTENSTTNSLTTLTESSINIGGSSLVNSAEEFNLIASNFITAGSAEIIAKNNLNILDGKEIQTASSSSEISTTDTGVQIGNAYVDAVHAVGDAIEAQEKVKDAYDKLEKIEKLHDQDMASSKAVDRARYQVVIALVNAGLSVGQAMIAVGNAGTAALTSFGTGFYGSSYVDISESKSTNSTEISQSIASNLVAGNDLSLVSGSGDINITGSNVSSTNGNLNLTAMLGNLNIKAGESTYSQSSKTNSRNLGGGVGTNGYSANLGFGEAESSFDQTTFTNSIIAANNGTLNISTKQDANIIGANLLAKDITMNIEGNLLLKSKQNLLESDSYNFGLSGSIAGGQSAIVSGASNPLSSSSYQNPLSGGINGGGSGISVGDSYQSRAFVDNQTSIIGTNSVNINVGSLAQNSGNTNIVAALIANRDSSGNDLGNLTITTKSLTSSDLHNYNNSDSNNFSSNLQVGRNPNDPTRSGNLYLNLSMHGSEQSSDSIATIGAGNLVISSNPDNNIINRDITLTETNKRSQLTSDFDAELKIDLRLLAALGNLIVGDTNAANANASSYWDSVVSGAKITYEFTPIGVNKAIEKERGSDQTLAWGDPAVYKSGKEENGVLQPEANNVGIANVPKDKEGNFILENVGQPVDFGSGWKGLKKWASSGNEGSLMSQACNYAIPGCNDMSKTHDNWGQNSDFIKNTPYALQLSIPPAYVYNTYGLIGKPINSIINYIIPKNYIVNIGPISTIAPNINSNSQQR